VGGEGGNLEALLSPLEKMHSGEEGEKHERGGAGDSEARTILEVKREVERRKQI